MGMEDMGLVTLKGTLSCLVLSLLRTVSSSSRFALVVPPCSHARASNVCIFERMAHHTVQCQERPAMPVD